MALSPLMLCSWTMTSTKVPVKKVWRPNDGGRGPCCHSSIDAIARKGYSTERHISGIMQDGEWAGL